MFVQSRLIQDVRCSAVCDCCCLILFFMMSHTFSIGDRRHLLCQSNHAVVAHAEWDLALSWYNNHGLPMKDILGFHGMADSIFLCTIQVYASMSMVPSHICQSPVSLLHPIPWQMFAFAYVANESLDGPLWSLGLKTLNQFFLETSWIVDSSE